jgi:hypothetical protein
MVDFLNNPEQSLLLKLNYMIRLIAILISLAGLSFVLFLLFSKRQKPWNEMTEKEQKKKKIMILSGTTVFLTGLIAALLVGKKK